MSTDERSYAFGDVDAPLVVEMRGVPVVLDEDIARLFGVETRRLNEQVKRNAERFGDDFAFRLTTQEFAALKSRIATSSSKVGRRGGHGGRRKPPWMFTEHGVVMAATLLRSEQAVAASRFIVKVFVEARRNQLVAGGGQNLPAKIDPRDVLPMAADLRHGLMGKLNSALGRVLDAIADPKAQTTVKDEARSVAVAGLNSIKEHLKKPGVQNEKTLAEVRKLLAEAEALDAGTASQYTEYQHRQLALLAKQLRLVIVARQYLETGSVEDLLMVLKELEGAGGSPQP